MQSGADRRVIDWNLEYYEAIKQEEDGTPKGNRTPVSGVRGQRPNR